MTQEYAISIEPHLVKNCWTGRGPHRPVAVVEHMMQGTIENTERYFKGLINGFKVSAHYGVARDGRVWQFVREEDTAWSNGVIQEPDTSLDWVRRALENNINLNLLTISVEHEGKSGEPLTQAQYEATLALHRQILERWNIPADEQHIVGHNRLDSLDRAGNPGSAFPFEHLLADLTSAAPRFTSEIFEGPVEEEEKPAPAPEPPDPEAEEEPESEVPFTVEALEQGHPLSLRFNQEIPTFHPQEQFSSATYPEALPEEQGGNSIVWASLGGGVVKVELANIRVRPSYEPSTIMNTAARGTRLHFDGYSEGPELQGSTIWLHISRDYGYGWIHSVLVQLDKPFNFPGRS